MARQRRPARPARGGRLRAALLSGNRLYLFAVVLVLGLVVAMAVGPLRVYTSSADRVDALEQERDELRDEVDALEERREELDDPDRIELLARSRLGLVMPDEEPYVVVVPEDDDLGVDEADEDGDDDEGDAWWRRVGRWLDEALGGG